jgi:hypothetical protein
MKDIPGTLIEREDGYFKYVGHTVTIEWDPFADPNDWSRESGGVIYTREFPEGRIIDG